MPLPVFLVVVQRPANATSVGWVVVFALHNVLGAAIVESEDFVVQVEPVAVYLESPGQAVAGLRIKLVVRIEA